MKMILGTGSPTDFGLYISNCQTRQRKYKIPVPSLLEVQLYIAFGADNPGDTVEINLVYTCGPLQGTTEPLTPVSYVIGQDPDLNYYGVFKGFNESTVATGFVISIEFADSIWFSEEYEFEICKPLTEVLGCYGNLEPEISFDAEDIYFGQSQGGTLGDASVVYEHKFFMRDVEVSLNAIKNDFKSGQTRNFRTESTNLFLFWGEFIPAWYLTHVDAVFKRGEVYVGDNKWLLDNTIYENLEDCTQCWRPAVLLKKNHNNSFSCEEDPCTVVVDGGGGETPEPCCSPTNVQAYIDGFGEGGNTVCLDWNSCEPTPANGYTILYRKVGSVGGYTSIEGVETAAFCFEAGGEDGDQYEGFFYSDCGDGITGSQIPWSTGTPETYAIARIVCAGPNSQFEITGGTPGDIVTVRASYGGFMSKIGGLFVRADLTLNSDGIPASQVISSPCYADTSGHGFGPLVAETVITLTGTSTIVYTAAVVNNASAGSNSFSVGIVDVNGTTKDIWAIGCHGNSSTGGTC